MELVRHDHNYPVATIGISKSRDEIMALLRADSFGLINWGRAMKANDDAVAFAVHTGLLNLKKTPICVCGCVRKIKRRNGSVYWA